jgi:hypothetical protein
MPTTPKYRHSYTPVLLLLVAAALCLTSCSRLITGTLVEPTVNNLQRQTDLDLVCEGAPAYLLMIDSMIASSPEDKTLLRIGAQSYSAYTSALAECGAERRRILAIADKAKLYGNLLIGKTLPTPPSVQLERLAQATKADVPSLFWGAMAWLTWIQQQQGTPQAMADLVIIEKIMARLLDLDETFQAGALHLFFGGLQATKPAMLGGNPESSRRHFERALEISHRQFLLIQTTYAETFARNTFNRNLHDRLLHEVIDFPLASAPAFALANQIAKKKAARLLADDYFAE